MQRAQQHGDSRMPRAATTTTRLASYSGAPPAQAVSSTTLTPMALCRKTRYTTALCNQTKMQSPGLDPRTSHEACTVTRVPTQTELHTTSTPRKLQLLCSAGRHTCSCANIGQCMQQQGHSSQVQLLATTCGHFGKQDRSRTGLYITQSQPRTDPDHNGGNTETTNTAHGSRGTHAHTPCWNEFCLTNNAAPSCVRAAQVQGGVQQPPEPPKHKQRPNANHQPHTRRRRSA